jgi:hypothetical protein
MTISLLFVFGEINAVYCENEDINTFCWQNAQVSDVNSVGMCN